MTMLTPDWCKTFHLIKSSQFTDNQLISKHFNVFTLMIHSINIHYRKHEVHSSRPCSIPLDGCRLTSWGNGSHSYVPGFWSIPSIQRRLLLYWERTLSNTQSETWMALHWRAKNFPYWALCAARDCPLPISCVTNQLAISWGFLLLLSINLRFLNEMSNSLPEASYYSHGRSQLSSTKRALWERENKLLGNMAEVSNFHQHDKNYKGEDTRSLCSTDWALIEKVPD